MRWWGLVATFVVVMMVVKGYSFVAALAGAIVYATIASIGTRGRGSGQKRSTIDPHQPVALQPNGLPPQEWRAADGPYAEDTALPDELPVVSDEATVEAAAVSTIEVIPAPPAPIVLDYDWIDPRRWATLVRAYALFLMLAALWSYNDTWRLVLGRWMFFPTEAAVVDAWLQPMKVAIFLLPFIASQLFTAIWLLLIRARRPDENDRAYRIAQEVFSGIGYGRGYRSARIVVAAVAQPYLVSILGKPFLILPRQGLAYFEQRGSGDAEQSFRAVIAHEAGHRESWDDLLFLPSFSYLAASALLCLFGLYQSIVGRISLPAVLAQSFMLCALMLLATYVVRRREAYSDSFGVVALHSVTATKTMLETLQREASAKHSWLTTHFDVRTRLGLLARRGRPFLDMTRYDLGITAFIYFNLDKPSVSGMAAGAGIVWILSTWIDALTHFAMTWMLILMIAGAAFSRRGERLPAREVLGAAVLSVIGRSVYDFMRVGVFGFAQIQMTIGITIATTVISGISFLLVMTVLNRWTVAIVGRPGGDSRERLVWGALWITALFLLPTLLYELGGALFVRSFANSSAVETLGGGSTSQQVEFMIPMFAMVGLLWLCWIGGAIGVAVWSWKRSRSIPVVQCVSCGMMIRPSNTSHPIALTCPRCGAVLRPDLIVEIEPAGAVA